MAYWLQKSGANIIMNVLWGDERTYDFVFEGLQQGGTYAVGTNGNIRNKLDRYYFRKGLAKMVELLRPDTIVNYSSKAKDIFEPYIAQGIEVITLSNWRHTFRKLAD